MMDITEDMVIHVCEKVLGSTKVMYQGVEIDFSKGWKRMTMAEAVKEYAGIDFMALSPEEALEAVKAKGLEIEKGKESWGDLMALCYDEYVEANLMQRPLSPIIRSRSLRWPSASRTIPLSPSVLSTSSTAPSTATLSAS